jgi:hypothetical protein
MKIHAYVLAADPTWLRASVSRYYPHVEKLVVSYDSTGRGWTGASVRLGECLTILRSIDVDGKIEWLTGEFAAHPGESYVSADTRQRRHALAHAGAGADWVLQIDTDEVLPHWSRLYDTLEHAAAVDLSAVEWPMRVLFRRLRGGRYLEIATAKGMAHYEYPGPIAVRPDVTLVECRRTNASYLRPVVRGDEASLQVRRPPEAGEHRLELLTPTEAIWHNSWARPPAIVRQKLASWSHNQGIRSWLYYYITWLPAPLTWRLLRELHPLHRPLWPRLRASSGLPDAWDD